MAGVQAAPRVEVAVLADFRGVEEVLEAADRQEVGDWSDSSIEHSQSTIRV